MVEATGGDGGYAKPHAGIRGGHDERSGSQSGRNGGNDGSGRNRDFAYRDVPRCASDVVPSEICGDTTLCE